jgi:hypothetical protein
MLGIGRSYFENIRNHLLTNGLLSRVHGNVKVHGLPSPVRSVNRVTQSVIFLPAELSFTSVHRDFLAGLKEDSRLHDLKYDAFRKLWHQLTPYIQIVSPRTDLCEMKEMSCVKNVYVLYVYCYIIFLVLFNCRDLSCYLYTTAVG